MVVLLRRRNSSLLSRAFSPDLFRYVLLALVLGPCLCSPIHELFPTSESVLSSAGENRASSAVSMLGSSLAAGLPRLPAARARVELLDEREAWKRLPVPVRGGGGPLPVWARALAGTLPHTTAAMLELEASHRSCSALAPKLRAQLRWVAAQANRCRYSEAYALADLRRAGVDEEGLRELAGDLGQLPEAQRAALVFARKLTEAGHSISDAEVDRLVQLYGESQVVAMVLIVAYANFQDRLVLALNLPLEEKGPLPPFDVRFSPIPLGERIAVARPRRAQRRAAPVATGAEFDPTWPALDYRRLQEEMNQQRARRARIKLPTDGTAVINWGLVCRTYQPELAAAWEACTRTFGAETEQDPILEQSIFWVVTRTLTCFY